MSEVASVYVMIAEPCDFIKAEEPVDVWAIDWLCVKFGFEHRQREAQRLASLNESVILKHPQRLWIALAGPDMSKPGMFRTTWIDQRGEPFGHTQARTLHGAIELALSEGYEAHE